MTACTQPECTGTIVDGYCDICGAPAGAAPFHPAKSAASAPGGEAGATAACTQPGCPGTLVDDYCDICGAPAGVEPFVPAGAASSASSAAVNERGLAAVPAPTPASALVEEELPTQRVPRVKVPTQQLSAREMADPGAGDPRAVDARKGDGEKELAEDGPNDAQGYRTRVEEAQLPGDVREAALREVDKLERASDQSPESGDIRTWLDTILELPWGTKTADWIDIQGSREAEATLRKLIEPTVADVEEGDTAEVGPAVADTQKADRAPAGPHNDDTVEIPALFAVPSEGRHPNPQLLEPPAPTPASALVEEEELPTQRIPQVKVPTEQLSAKEMADPGAVDAQKGDGEKELAEDGPNDAQGYRTRVEEAELPGDVREAALRKVDKLERASDHSPESGDIRTWLDTILELPWGTKTADWIDIEGSREAEATLRKLIEPTVADVEEGDAAEVGAAVADVEEGDTADVDPVGADLEEDDTAKVDPATADSGNADRASAGPHDDDTVQAPAVLAGFSGRGHPRPQLPEQQVVGPVLVETPTEKRRFRSRALATTVLALLLIGALLFAAGRDRGVTAQSAPTVTATATATVSKPTSQPSDKSTGTAREESTIQLDDLPDSARPFQTVRIQGKFRGGADTFLRVQRWEGGKWLDFPLTTKTDRSGKFTAYVELGGRGRYQLRVLDSDSLVTSKTFVVVITG